MRVRACAAAAALIVVAATGCGSSSSNLGTLKVKGGAGAPAAQAKGKAAVPGSPDLKLAVDPASGPPGTVVRITATGCVDATGLNHAVSFNAAAGRAAGQRPGTVRTVGSTLSGTTLTASYTVRNADRAAAHGVFYVQCGSSLAQQPFTVTR